MSTTTDLTAQLEATTAYKHRANQTVRDAVAAGIINAENPELQKHLAGYVFTELLRQDVREKGPYFQALASDLYDQFNS